MKKVDVIIIAATLFVCAALFLASHFLFPKQHGNMSAEIYVAGELVQTVFLTDTAKHEYIIKNGAIVLSAEENGLAVIYADCASQSCVHTGKITQPGQIIACLPNRVIIKLKGEDAFASEVDAIAQ